MFESSPAVFSLSRSRKISEPSRASHKNFHFNFFHVFTEFNVVSYNNRFNNVNCRPNSVFPFRRELGGESNLIRHFYSRSPASGTMH